MRNNDEICHTSECRMLGSSLQGRPECVHCCLELGALLRRRIVKIGHLLLLAKVPNKDVGHWGN